MMNKMSQFLNKDKIQVCTCVTLPPLPCPNFNVRQLAYGA